MSYEEEEDTCRSLAVGRPEGGQRVKRRLLGAKETYCKGTRDLI
jgi:hypothetical protein